MAIAYPYDDVVKIVDDFGNMTWLGSAKDNTTLKGTDDRVGASRTFNFDGNELTQTLTKYEKHDDSFMEEQTIEQVTLQFINASLYSTRDVLTLNKTCDGKASVLNLTTAFCSTNASDVARGIGLYHMAGIMRVTEFLGGKNFTSCAASNGTSNGTSLARTTGVITTDGKTSTYTSAITTGTRITDGKTTTYTSVVPTSAATSSSRAAGDAVQAQGGNVGGLVFFLGSLFAYLL